jgi:hypothetical protein
MNEDNGQEFNEDPNNKTQESTIQRVVAFGQQKMSFARTFAVWMLLITIAKLAVVVFNYIVGWIIPVLGASGYNLFSLPQIALIAPIVLVFTHYDRKKLTMVDKKYEAVFTPLYIILAFVFLGDVIGLAKMCWAWDQNAKAGWVASNVTMNLLPWSDHTALGGQRGWVLWFLLQAILHVVLTIILFVFIYRIRNAQFMITRSLAWLLSEFGIDANELYKRFKTFFGIKGRRHFKVHPDDKTHHPHKLVGKPKSPKFDDDEDNQEEYE